MSIGSPQAAAPARLAMAGQPVFAAEGPLAGDRAVCWRAMTLSDLDAVMGIEQSAYSHPWSRGNFVDSIAAGYPAWLRLTADATPGGPAGLLGYYVAMPGVDEMHLLNITVRPTEQGRGHARAMLVHLARLALGRGAHTLWLEVRRSNERARHLYDSSGFVAVGVRKGYYPADHGQREDAIVMRWPPLVEGSSP